MNKKLAAPNPCVLVVCLNPTFQQTMVFPRLWEGEVNRSVRHYLDASGKGMNVARVLAQSGRKATLLTHLGGPRVAEMLQLISESGVEVAWADSGSEIRTCTTVINEEHGTTTELVQEPYPVHPGTEKKILPLYERLLPTCQAVVFTGTRAPGYSQDLYPRMVGQAKRMDKLVVLDVKGRDLVESLQFGPDIMKPNLSEFSATFLPEREVREQEDNGDLRPLVEAIAARLYKRHGTRTVLTRGSHSAWYYDGVELQAAPTERVEAVNTIGCGDAFTAGLVGALLDGGDLQQSVIQAVHYGALNARSIRPGSIEMLQ